MERKNSEESVADNKDSSREEETVENEANVSEDEFGMRIVQKESDDDSSKDSKAIPLVIIEPKVDVEEARKILIKAQVNNPPLKMERIEEKTCLQMSARGLTIAKNLDYEDIESLPEITATSPTPPRTPPALPPKPQFRNNTLVLKKIPSPSFLIDEKRQQDPGGADPIKRNILGLVSSSSSKAARSLNLEEAKNSTRSSARETKDREEGGFWKNRFNHVRSSFQVRQKESDQAKGAVRVTNIVRHFEEFKIGDPEEQMKDRNRPKDRHVELEHVRSFIDRVEYFGKYYNIIFKMIFFSHCRNLISDRTSRSLIWTSAICRMIPIDLRVTDPRDSVTLASTMSARPRIILPKKTTMFLLSVSVTTTVTVKSQAVDTITFWKRQASAISRSLHLRDY